MSTSPRSTRELSAARKREVTTALLNSMCLGKLPRGTIKAIAAQFELDRKTVRTLWNRSKTGNTATLKLGRVGPTRQHSAEEIKQLIRQVPSHQRSTLRDVAEATGLSTFVFSHTFKSGIMHRRSSRLKPLLTATNRLERLAYCGAHVNLTQEAVNAYLAGVDALNASSDEGINVASEAVEWFNANKDSRKTYLVDGEDVGYRACKSKRFIAKVMFLCAVARPREEDGFDGKIGMWPFVTQVPAARNSRNRPAGTMVTTLINVDAATYRDYVVNKVISAIKANFRSLNKRVVLQHDNATPHRSIDNGTLAQVSTDGWTFVVRCQPSNSPDHNVLDLGFFASIQTLQYKTVSRTVNEVIASTMIAFETLESEKLANVFLTLQGIMRLVLEHRGGNHFKLPHLKKDALRHTGNLPTNLSCPVSLLFKANSYHVQQSGL
ncbi:hypothetical protein H257_03349 [Aphanomyces astaci]|uniref:DUF7769 domain-containing protein n=1 Tax=Aphanomyces astaci TaxID=112090 RepID=W4GW80_APHAT|nr:hypothetical protein H257_03349 [Aphanomyces astaci]ETV83985.1 hypothetical protein H257_03349 [Aphanomyces astaci]|eukprot:XP_009825677.1 hypothetical protein H257_03349 [Aphanomyces astaci]